MIILQATDLIDEAYNDLCFSIKYNEYKYSRYSAYFKRVQSEKFNYFGRGFKKFEVVYEGVK